MKLLKQDILKYKDFVDEGEEILYSPRECEITFYESIPGHWRVYELKADGFHLINSEERLKQLIFALFEKKIELK